MASIVLGVAGGIAAYKSALLLRKFTEAGHDVQVVPTAASLNFVGAATWEALSGHSASADVFENIPEVAHVRIGRHADLVVVAPASADLLARATHGMADDLLTATLLTCTAPVLMAPAMHTEMWEHPATRANIATLRSRGINVLEPASGRLTGADSGPGRLPEPEAIYAAAIALLGSAETGSSSATGSAAAGSAETGSASADDGEPAGRGSDLAGTRVLISAGGTREPLDPVRYLGNHSSGRQGVALAKAALARGGQVTLVGANLEVPPPDGISLVPVSSAAELAEAMLREAAQADIVIMSAAVADYRPASVETTKIKKTSANEELTLRLVRNPDILRSLVQARSDRSVTDQVIVGFAAETGDADGTVLDHARKKFEAKGCDLLVVNKVGTGVGFGTDGNRVDILARRRPGGEPEVIGSADGSKLAVSHAVIDALGVLRS
ncbi:bifunctional phosphopantothenoylcysteine decarboxylase/phosphopantothenate synthase [Saxibacter everestensis]|uniref:Coenzyme A biosynthesis bifunctional protein CoaBC n=1 Tax=Saxibacter everestensis TaxID=2909229 RepID=A0ABY8QXN4_9MICO|nr:bifunctional phosphopantothenoylcysteine decarboxylase/phosphopantothenate synthase [Brevibacteriaceae bacterium ZFBP1038]